MENSYRFFKNIDCQYYPCHEGIEDINCLFCYCPMYRLQNCPGSFEMIEAGGKQIKSCMNCTFPHKSENYDKIVEILKHNP